MGFWDKIKKDTRKGIEDGLKSLRVRAEELTEEGKGQLRLFELRAAVHREMADLGGQVYHLSGSSANPLTNTGVKATVAKIKKMEAEISSIETRGSKKAKAAKKKSAPKKTARRKTATKRAARKSPAS